MPMVHCKDKKQAFFQAGILLEAVFIVYAITGDLTGWLYLPLVPCAAYVLTKIYRETKTSGAVVILAAAFSVCNIIGQHYDVSDNALELAAGSGQTFHTLMTLAGCFFISEAFFRTGRPVLGRLGGALTAAEEENEEHSLRSIIKYTGFFALGWLPYLLINYPGHLMGDSYTQIAMANNLKNGAVAGVNLLSPDVFITNHHPVLHTFLLGGLINLGHYVFHNDNFGFFLYTLLQYLVVVCSLGYAISWLGKWFVSRTIKRFLCAFFFVTPFFAEYTITATKDILYTAFFLLFTLKCAELLFLKNDRIGWRWWLTFGALGLLCILFRRNGYLTLIGSAPFFLLAAKRHRRGVFVFFLAMTCLNTVYIKCLLPAFKITAPSSRVIFSVPLQQTARYLNLHEEDVTEEEKAIINTVVDYEKCKERYNPREADPIIKTFRKTAGRKDIINYLKVWRKMFLRHPGCCIQATLLSQNGSYSFGKTIPWNYTVYHSFAYMKKVEKLGYHLYLPSKIRPVRVWLANLVQGYRTIPLLNLTMQAAFYNWILVIACFVCLFRRNWNGLALLAQPAVMLVITLMGPTNGRTYFRYTYPIAAVLPIAGCVLLYVKLRKQS